ncbi:hypothetical protein ONE63_008050 [Megalurothrips usitatus]|uniref:Uncharacterized protein n=1 Tax=Megalurothrips usitatus TaxID=439358 RepID=A0AAV7XUH5_9NEOP|nr:hypothetical protein ONE63_008050 [Megalurothrips usitatus]
MPRLRRLEVYSDRRQLAALAGLRFPRGAAPAGLRWLRVGVYPLATALSLARAHAHTLEELHLVAASAEPYGCPDLAAELGRCGLGKLRRLVLVRRTGDYLCGHDAAECRRQKRQLATVPTAPRVECSACDNVDPPAF